MSKIVVIGAGKTGRGFIARLISESGLEFTLVDKDKELINRLNKENYKISFFGNKRESITIDNFKAVCWEDSDFSDCELIFVSVGGTNLEDVGNELKKRLNEDKKYYIITGENCSNPSGRLKAVIGSDNVYISEATVFCTTIESDGLNINSENYPYLQCDADLLNGYIPEVKAVRAIEKFGNFLTRKLYTYNAASCVIAYLGWIEGIADYAKAANNPKILKYVDKNYAVTNRVLCKEFGYDEKDQAEFAKLSRDKFTDDSIVDTVARNAREPQRKIADNERVIGPMKLMEKYKEDSSVLQMTAAAMLLYDNDGEDAWRKIKAENTCEEILENIAGVKKGTALFDGIMKYYHEFEKRKSL